MNMENDFNKLMIDKGEIEEKIIESGRREIVADPSEENTALIKVLLRNGFKKKSDGDYRKII